MVRQQIISNLPNVVFELDKSLNQTDEFEHWCPMKTSQFYNVPTDR